MTVPPDYLQGNKDAWQKQASDYVKPAEDAWVVRKGRTGIT